MQNIKIKEFSKDATGFRVFLGNGTRHVFSSAKKKNLFLANTGKFLTSKLYELHGIYSALLQKYNDCWAYMDTEPVKSRKLREALEATEKSFELAVTRCRYKEGNAFTFHHLANAAHYLKTVSLALERDNFRRSLAHERYQFDSFILRLQAVENDLNTYGQRTADFIAMPQHVSSMSVLKTKTA